MSEPSKSPIKDKPLRLPGQSLQEERERLFDDKVESWLLQALMMSLLAAVEWVRYFQKLPPLPWLFTGVALGVSAFAAWRFFTVRPRLRQLRLGVEGEVAVGQFLERLRETGYQVFHDVPGDGFNLDHVCVGPAGAFTIETKTWSKPAKGNARVTWDGEKVRIGGHEPERDPVTQAQAQAKWLARTLEESTGRRVHVWPVIVFPGWFVEAAPGAQQAVWVMEPKGLPTFLSNEPTRLLSEDVKLVSYHLSRYIRARERERV